MPGRSLALWKGRKTAPNEAWSAARRNLRLTPGPRLAQITTFRHSVRRHSPPGRFLFPDPDSPTMSLTITWQNVESLRRFDNALKALGDKKMRAVANRAVNRAGDAARTQVRRELPKQTGLSRKLIVQAVRVTRSSPATLTYRMTSFGGDIALKHFGARETRGGVSAAPFGQRKVFPGTFIMGGRFPNRVDIGMGGHVFERTGTGRFPIEKQKSGVIIPAEMVKGATKDAFERTVSTVLPQRIEHEIKRATGGVIS